MNMTLFFFTNGRRKNNICICLLDFKKAYDIVQREKLERVLDDYKVIIIAFYRNSRACVVINRKEKTAKIGIGN